MADFPKNPYTGQKHTIKEKTWVYNSESKKWVLIQKRN